MPDFTIVDAKPYHCGQMIRLLRLEHQEAVARTGVHAHRELRALFDNSAFRRAWLIDGKLAALGGVACPMASAYGFVWLTLSKQAIKYPLAIVKESRRQLAEIMQTKHELITTVLGGDDAARRLAVFLGFHVSHEGQGQPAFSRIARRDLSRFIETNPDLRVSVGDGYAVLMGYHPESEAA